VAEDSNPIWWIELIKISPGLIAVTLAVVVFVANYKELRALLSRTTKFKGLGIEVEFTAHSLDNAIEAQKVAVSPEDRKGVLQRLQILAPWLRDMRLLWVDDNPENTRNERALLDRLGARVTTVKTSAEAERELRENDYLLVITDIKRENKETEGLEFVKRMVTSKTYRWTIAYVGTDQWDHARPPYLFGITNRPDHLMHLICDVVERERR
jgi:CheY-like chemotaxis protein